MPSAIDYFLSTGIDEVRSATVQTLGDNGFRVTTLPDGNLVAERGSLGATVALGALAGSRFHVKFPVSFFTAPDGRTVVRLSRTAAAGAIKGGALGAARTAKAFDTTTAALHAAFSADGALTESLAQP
ncbi:MAG: hypothetical protein QM635_00150 [Microbacteriaceae bacterium]